jgi:flagellar protein FlaH
MTDKDGKKTTISAGNAELDSRMGGGLPVGSLTLVEGGSGAGKSVLSQQILWGALQDGFTVSLFTSENSVKSLVSQMRSISLDIFDFLLIGKFKVYPVEFSRLGERAVIPLIEAMKNERERGRDFIVIDSLTTTIVNASSNQVALRFIEECKRLCTIGTTILVTLHAQAIPQDLLVPLRSMCDANVNLRSEQDGQKLVKTLEVSKIRGAASSTGAIVGFDVEPGWGMRVIPISKARG